MTFRVDHAVTSGTFSLDGQTFEDIQKYGIGEWLRELTEELKNKTYQASPVLRAWILKEDGKQRPLGIPTIRDRVVQTAAMLVLEPIFEADLQPEQHAYRHGKSAWTPSRRFRDCWTRAIRK